MSKALSKTIEAWLESGSAILRAGDLQLSEQVETVVAELQVQSVYAVWVDSTPIQGKVELLKALYLKLKLPGWFGFNYDALQDALEMLEPVNNQPWVLVFKQFDLLRANDPDCAESFIEICRQVTEIEGSALFKVVLL